MLMLAAILIVLLQAPYETYDSRCEGVVLRLLDGGPAQGDAGACWHGESVRLRLTVLVGVMTVAGVALELVAARRKDRSGA
jgi:hypothetical protein